MTGPHNAESEWSDFETKQWTSLREIVQYMPKLEELNLVRDFCGITEWEAEQIQEMWRQDGRLKLHSGKQA